MLEPFLEESDTEYECTEFSRNYLLRELEKSNFEYSKGKLLKRNQVIVPDEFVPEILRNGTSAVRMEFDRAIKNLENDAPASLTAAISLLEASLKAFMLIRSETDELSDKNIVPLWNEFMRVQKINSSSLKGKDKSILEIANGLNKVLNGTRELRNSRSSAHGRTQTQIEERKISHPHARLVVNAAFALSCYIMRLHSGRRIASSHLPPPVTGDTHPLHILRHGHRRPAQVRRMRTAGGEHTALRRIDR